MSVPFLPPHHQLSPCCSLLLTPSSVLLLYVCLASIATQGIALDTLST